MKVFGFIMLVVIILAFFAGFPVWALYDGLNDDSVYSVWVALSAWMFIVSTAGYGAFLIRECWRSLRR